MVIERATESELQDKLRRQQRLRRQRARERELLNKPKQGKQVPTKVHEFHVAQIVDSADDEIHTTGDLARERNKDVPFVVGHSGMGRPPHDVSLTRELKAVLGAKAMHVEDARTYCELSGIDPTQATVKQCVVHNLIYWTLKGSAPHMKELMERVDGKVIPVHDPMANGKMSITDAVNMLEMKTEEEEEE